MAEHIIIDGYNLLHALPEGRKRLRRAGTAVAADYLVGLARRLHDQTGHTVSVVFDGKGPTTELAYPSGGNTFAVIHAAANEGADSVIERMAIAARTLGAARVTVYSEDRLIVEACRASGATVFDAKAFATEVTVETGRLRIATGKPEALRNGLFD